MGIAWKSRLRYLHDTQFRRSRGLFVLVVGGGRLMGEGYDLLVAQAAEDPTRWLRARDVLDLLPWYGWAIAGLGVLAIFLFEGGYRASKPREPSGDGTRDSPITPSPNLGVMVWENNYGWGSPAVSGYPDMKEKRILRLYLHLVPTYAMRVERVEADVAGETLRSDWTSQMVSPNGSTSYVYFGVPDSMNAGEHDVTVVALGDGQWRSAPSVLVAFPQEIDPLASMLGS